MSELRVGTTVPCGLLISLEVRRPVVGGVGGQDALQSAADRGKWAVAGERIADRGDSGATELSCSGVGRIGQ